MTYFDYSFTSQLGTLAVIVVIAIILGLIIMWLYNEKTTENDK